jgi:predicted nucleic acid-binding Zn ribbon protein
MDALALPSVARATHKGSHRRCARCGKVVSSRALVCRRCGKKQRMNPRTTLLLLAGVFLIALFGVATVQQRFPFLRARDVVSSDAFRAPAAPVLAPRAVTSGDLISATDLWGLYNLDASRADARFKNKSVSVTGVVADVRREFAGAIVLRLVAGESFETVRAVVVNRDYAPRSAPARGQTVSLRCMGHGALIGSPLLDACVAI